MDSITAELFSVPAASQGIVVLVRIVAAALANVVQGVAAGIGPLWVLVVSAACAWVILYVFASLERESAAIGQPKQQGPGLLLAP